MNHTKYLDKYYTILDSNWFTKLGQDPTCYIEKKRSKNTEESKMHDVSKSLFKALSIRFMSG